MREIELLQYPISYWYGKDQEMTESGQEHVEKMIGDGYNRGELVDGDNRGWWWIKDAQKNAEHIAPELNDKIIEHKVEKLETKYRWSSSHEWFLYKVRHDWNIDELRVNIALIIHKLSGNSIQEEFQNQMDADGYFDPYSQIGDDDAKT